ncbi:helix-turn-helix transcriptional regulator [Pseudomonas aeruginosa]|uniref:helix-turn-helix transcriptional regulator n=1 Tax=Pseudomonas aeruginosa TaxID=287 RepID=UPI003D9B6387
MSLSQLMGAPLQFDAETASLDFAPDALSLHIVRTPDEIPRLMRHAPASLIQVLVEQAALPTQLIALLQQSMPHSLTLEEAASQMAMSPRTLHRKLAALGESFQSIEDGWRFRQASQLLSCTDNPVKQIAMDLGFSDQATFRRAFSQWAGHLPGILRRARLESVKQNQ